MRIERDNALLDVEKLEKTVGILEEKVQSLEGTVDGLNIEISDLNFCLGRD